MRLPTLQLLSLSQFVSAPWPADHFLSPFLAVEPFKTFDLYDRLGKTSPVNFDGTWKWHLPVKASIEHLTWLEGVYLRGCLSS